MNTEGRCRRKWRQKTRIFPVFLQFLMFARYYNIFLWHFWKVRFVAVNLACSTFLYNWRNMLKIAFEKKLPKWWFYGPVLKWDTTTIIFDCCAKRTFHGTYNHGQLSIHPCFKQQKYQIFNLTTWFPAHFRISLNHAFSLKSDPQDKFESLW